MPTPSSTSRASSASSGFTIRSRSWSDSGPPRAHAARPPPSMNGTPASRSAAAAFLRVASMASKSSFTIPLRGTLPRLSTKQGTVRIAAAGDIHCSPERRAEIEASFARIAEEADIVLLAGDLTTHGEPDEAAVTVLERAWTVEELNGTRVGIAGTKGFVGGFPDSALPDFGEPVLRQVYAETTAGVAALRDGLEAIPDCPLRSPL